MMLTDNLNGSGGEGRGLMKTRQSIKITSYNCRGFKSSVEELKQLFTSTDILAVQEHWLISSEFGQFYSLGEDVSSVPHGAKHIT